MAYMYTITRVILNSKKYLIFWLTFFFWMEHDSMTFLIYTLPDTLVLI